MESEQLLSLSGSALAQAVSSLLETPGLYVFSDILELPNVKEVSTTSRFLFLRCVVKSVAQQVMDVNIRDPFFFEAFVKLA